MNQKTKRRKTMSKKTQFTGSKNKIRSLSWTSPIYQHGKGKYQNKILEDNIPGYPGYHISRRGKGIFKMGHKWKGYSMYVKGTI